MIPYLLAVAGGYLIGTAKEDGDVFAKGGSVSGERNWVVKFESHLSDYVVTNVKGKTGKDAINAAFDKWVRNGKITAYQEKDEDLLKTGSPEFTVTITLSVSELNYDVKAKSKHEAIDVAVDRWKKKAQAYLIEK